MSNELAPRNMAEMSFTDKLGSFTELTDRRESLKRKAADFKTDFKAWARKNHINESFGKIAVFKEYKPNKDKDIVKAAKEQREVEWLTGVADYPTGLNSVLLRKFPGLKDFIEAVREEYETRVSKKIDEEATKKLQAEYDSKQAAYEDILNELAEVTGKIDSVKEFIDVADKVSRIGQPRVAKKD